MDLSEIFKLLKNSFLFGCTSVRISFLVSPLFSYIFTCAAVPDQMN